jgi:hypothetical protein
VFITVAGPVWQWLRGRECAPQQAGPGRRRVCRRVASPCLCAAIVTLHVHRHTSHLKPRYVSPLHVCRHPRAPRHPDKQTRTDDDDSSNFTTGTRHPPSSSPSMWWPLVLVLNALSACRRSLSWGRGSLARPGAWFVVLPCTQKGRHARHCAFKIVINTCMNVTWLSSSPGLDSQSACTTSTRRCCRRVSSPSAPR